MSKSQPDPELDPLSQQINYVPSGSPCKLFHLIEVSKSANINQ